MSEKEKIVLGGNGIKKVLRARRSVGMSFCTKFRDCDAGILSIGVVFFMRNASIRKKVLALVGYEFIVFILFTELNHESIIAILQWELKWILYFTISMILQFALYYFFWKKVKY